uniref:Uncharacterized protein n=1 Tax=Arundo donax TaxID=35708 RepID=A0A0A8ZNC8_ARUDO
MVNLVISRFTKYVIMKRWSKVHLEVR